MPAAQPLDAALLTGMFEPTRDLAEALRKTTEVLAQELASPTTRVPAWTEAEWRLARAVASIHGVSATLHGALRWHGPDGWQEFLAEQQHQTLVRHGRIVQLLEDIDTLTHRAGVPTIPLKGAALHALGIYAAGERPMADVDLLVHPSDASAVENILGQLGYEHSYTDWRHAVFEPRNAQRATDFGEHAGNPVKVEVHTRIVERLPVVDADVTRRIWRDGMAPGLNSYPSRAGLMIHLLLHAAGNMRLRALRSIHLQDIARLAARMHDEDWAAVTGDRALWWQLPPLSLTARYYPRAIPPQVMAAAAAACPRRLRRLCDRQTLTDVSLSNLYVEAFPGIEWSTTSAECVRYLIDRIWPDGEVLAARVQIMDSHPWMSGHSWSGLRHWQRVLRFMRGRQPRVHTLHSVAAVFRSEPAPAGSTET